MGTQRRIDAGIVRLWVFAPACYFTWQWWQYIDSTQKGLPRGLLCFINPVRLLGSGLFDISLVTRFPLSFSHCLSVNGYTKCQRVYEVQSRTPSSEGLLHMIFLEYNCEHRPIMCSGGQQRAVNRLYYGGSFRFLGRSKIGAGCNCRDENWLASEVNPFSTRYNPSNNDNAFFLPRQTICPAPECGRGLGKICVIHVFSCVQQELTMAITVLVFGTRR